MYNQKDTNKSGATLPLKEQEHIRLELAESGLVG